MQKIGLKRDLRCINPCKSGDGSYLKKLTSPPKGGGRNGNFRGSKNQKSGKCHELSRKSIKFVFTHPTRGGGGGSKFQKSGKFHELSRKSIKKKIYPPLTTTGGRSGNFKESKNQKSGKCHELPRKSINIFLPIPPRGGGGSGSKFQKSGKFHELSRKSIKIFFTPPPPKGVAVGILVVQKIKSPGNVMNCREK